MGKCKYYNNQWHMIIRNSVGSTIHITLTNDLVAKIKTTGMQYDGISWYTVRRNGTLSQYHGLSSTIGEADTTLPVRFTRSATGITWEIPSDKEGKYTDYKVPRKRKPAILA